MELNPWLIGLISLCSGLLGSLGLGAGTVLVLALRFLAGMDQLVAQGINLLFFLPIAALSVFLHARKGLVQFRPAFRLMLSALPFALLGAWLAGHLGNPLLSRLFGCLLVGIGVETLFKRKN